MKRIINILLFISIFICCLLLLKSKVNEFIIMITLSIPTSLCYLLGKIDEREERIRALG